MLGTILTWMGVLLQVGTLGVLVYRRRLRRLVTLPLLLAVVLASTVSVRVWPASPTWGTWLSHELAHATVLLLMGLEIALRLSLRLPDARREARQWIGPTLVGCVILLALTRSAPPTVGLLPLLMLAIAWIYVGLTLVARHHLIPVEPLHKTVLHGFTVYLVIYALGWTLTGEDTRIVNTLAPLAFNLLMLALLWAAWRKDDTPAGIPERTLLHFWPWRRFERPPDAPAPPKRERAAPPVIAPWSPRPHSASAPDTVRGHAPAVWLPQVEPKWNHATFAACVYLCKLLI